MKTVLLWRGSQGGSHKTLGKNVCGYCEGRLSFQTTVEQGRGFRFLTCLLCGWKAVDFIDDGELYFGVQNYSTVTVVREFDINSAEVGLAELGTYLKKNYTDVFHLSPSRFEELVGDVFKDHGHNAVVTQQSRDGGVDVFLENVRTGNIDVVIQCKRYATNNKVGISAVQRLAGVAIDWGASMAYLVTTSSYTNPAIRSADSIRKRGVVGLDLVGATDLLRRLRVYNEKLPSLDRLTGKVRNEIMVANEKEDSTILQ